MVKLSESNLTFNLTFQFKKCKNIVGNSDPNMSTLATFTICKCPNFWSGLTCTKLFWEGSTDLEKVFPKEMENFETYLPIFSLWPKSLFNLINLINQIVHLFQNKNTLICVFMLWVTRRILLKVDQRVDSLPSLAAVRVLASLPPSSCN